MSFITSALGWFSGLPGFVMVGLIFLVLGLVFRAGISTTIRSAIYVSAGILASTTVTQMMVNYVSPMASQLIENTALTNDVLDVGIAPAFSACITLPFFVFLYPIGLAVNENRERRLPRPVCNSSAVCPRVYPHRQCDSRSGPRSRLLCDYAEDLRLDGASLSEIF